MISTPWRNSFIPISIFVLLFWLPGTSLAQGSDHRFDTDPFQAALNDMDLARAADLLDTWPSLAATPLERGIYLREKGRLLLRQGDLEAAEDSARAAIQLLHDGEAAERTKALLLLAEVLRSQGRWGKAIRAAREALRLRPEDHDALRFDTFFEIAAGYIELTPTMINASKALNPHPSASDSTQKYIDLAWASLPAGDTLKRMAILNLRSRLLQIQPSRLDDSLPLLQEAEQLHLARQGRLSYPALQTYDLLSAYYLRTYKRPGHTELGMAASQTGLDMRAQIFGPDDPGRSRGLYMLAAHDFLYVDWRPPLKYPGRYDTVLQALQLAADACSPGFQSLAPYDFAAPDQIKRPFSYLTILGLMVRTHYLRYGHSQDSCDLAAILDIGREIRLIMAHQLAEIEDFYVLDSYYAQSQITIAVVIQALHDMFHLSGDHRYWEEALSLAEAGRAVKLRAELYSRYLSQDPKHLPAPETLPAFRIAEIRRDLLEPDQGMVLYHRARDYTLFILYVDQDTVQFHRMAEPRGVIDLARDTLKQEMERPTAALRAGAPSPAFVRASETLHEWFWAPLGDSLPARIRVVTSTDIEEIPLELLRDSTGTYLVERHVLSFAPGISLLALQSATAHGGNGRWLGLAPGFDGSPVSPCDGARRSDGELRPLCFAAEEVTAIHDLVGSGTLLTDAEATKDNILTKLGDYSVIHIASHAGTDEVRPDQVFVAGSNLTGEDPFIRMDDILAQDLSHTDLVVLSGCYTGRGVSLRGEAMASINWAFLAGGARSVLGSLWAVDDLATRQVMPHFYAAMKEGLPKDEAWQRAMKQYLAEGRSEHPYFWAGFRVFGDVAPVDLRAWWQRGWLWGLLGLLMATAGVGWWRKNREKG